MIGLDTNVIVRYIMQADPKQSPKASQLIESLSSEAPGYITMVSVVELYCVLTSCCGLRVFAVGRADFTDCLIERERAASSAGCTQTMTFDAAAAKHAGMTLIN